MEQSLLKTKRKMWVNRTDTRQKLPDEGFEWIKSGDGAEKKSGLCKEKGNACYANHVEKVAGKKEVLSADADFGYPDAALSGMESIYKRAEADNKKYIFRATGKFSKTNSNERRCILHFQIHNGVSRITRLF